ncbi:DD104 protein, upregulated upon bacterial challenge and trauma isoform X1 [Strongylocentrotus purpuratus]|uniref:Uncharacterized protein n=1 Tax=Strongylocentrotus purpuratus TaxID=7668 RepID=A0A7M7HP29_STRPU|nr:DD104 protein, upregulated upon bacterial challenge and trauma isoform X1 [Strongylocentrotus purpuratus]XP_011672694.1 DD104 protein, upregulated upon bacterial challenge and trauma isoform X1 [Strongylocentrotus purpuratus]|eukprot:XP_011672693.1 PREDICTED: DD104 protein, upregulated upon bacterial challenge and trauma isoform X1 [Strongylocentrotus purpuratus]
MLAVCLLTFIAALTAAVPTPTPGPPNGIPQCALSECPVYTELEDYGQDMWKRRIEPGVWARRSAPTCNRTAATDLVYYTDLQNYFLDNGIDRTTPVMFETVKNKARPTFCPDQSESPPCCAEIYAYLFYIPAASQANTPPPSQDSGVELVHMEDPREFYGITFGGRPETPNATEKYEQLHAYLVEQALPIETYDSIVAAYDAPGQPQPHRTEILIPVKGPRENKTNACPDNQNDSQENEEGRGDRDGGGRRRGGGAGGDGGGGRGDGRGRQRRNVHDLSNIDLILF